MRNSFHRVNYGYFWIQTYFLTIASLLGGGILRLPLALGDVEFHYFVLLLTSGYFVQLLVIVYIVDLFQRGWEKCQFMVISTKVKRYIRQVERIAGNNLASARNYNVNNWPWGESEPNISSQSYSPIHEDCNNLSTNQNHECPGDVSRDELSDSMYQNSLSHSLKEDLSDLDILSCDCLDQSESLNEPISPEVHMMSDGGCEIDSATSSCLSDENWMHESSSENNNCNPHTSSLELKFMITDLPDITLHYLGRHFLSHYLNRFVDVFLWINFIVILSNSIVQAASETTFMTGIDFTGVMFLMTVVLGLGVLLLKFDEIRPLMTYLAAIQLGAVLIIIGILFHAKNNTKKMAMEQVPNKHLEKTAINISVFFTGLVNVLPLIFGPIEFSKRGIRGFLSAVIAGVTTVFFLVLLWSFCLTTIIPPSCLHCGHSKDVPSCSLESRRNWLFWDTPVHPHFASCSNVNNLGAAELTTRSLKPVLFHLYSTPVSHILQYFINATIFLSLIVNIVITAFALSQHVDSCIQTALVPSVQVKHLQKSPYKFRTFLNSIIVILSFLVICYFSDHSFKNLSYLRYVESVMLFIDIGLFIFLIHKYARTPLGFEQNLIVMSMPKWFYWFVPFLAAYFVTLLYFTISNNDL